MNSNLANFITDNRGDGVFIIGHASALIKMNGRLIMCDPVWNHSPYGEHWTFFPEQVECDEIARLVDYCFVSHIHADHICEHALAKINRSINIMGGRNPLFRRLAPIQFVKSWEPRKWHSLCDGIDFYFAPHAFNSIDSSVFFRNTKTGFTIYHGNDNFLDSVGLQEAWDMVGKCDIAMVPYAFIHWFPFLMEGVSEDWRSSEIKRLNGQSVNQFYDFKDKFNPKMMIPFGASLFYDCGVSHILNRSLVKPYELHGATALLAGGYVFENGEGSVPMGQQEFDDGLLDKLGTWVEPGIDSEFSMLGVDLDVIRRKVRAAEKRVKNHELIVNKVVIDLDHLRVSVRSGRGSKPYTRFRFDKCEFMQWIEGKISFEQAIGTRRFRCERIPNVYNLQVFEWFNNYL